MARDIKIRITGDSSGLKSAFGDAEKSAEGFGSKIGSVIGGIAKVGGAVAIGGVAAAIPILKGAVDAASNMEETWSKSKVIFGDAQKDVANFALSAAKDFGQSEQQALDAASTFATFGKGAGLTGKDLASFSTRLVGLSSDLASFSNTSPEEAIDAIGSALRGEAEPIRKYGILLDDATLRNRALQLGLISTTKEALTPANKVLAAQAEILAQTGDAQGDFARTSDGLANKQRIVAARFADAQAQLGGVFLPLMLKLADFVLDKVIPAFESFNNWVQKIAETFKTAGWQEAAKEVLGKVGEIVSAIGAWIRDTGAPLLWAATKELARALVEWVKDPAWPWLLAHLQQWLADFGGWLWDTAIPWLGQQALELAKKLADWVVDPALPWLLSHLGEWLAAFGKWFATDALPWLGEQVWKLAGLLGEWVVDASKKLAENLPGWLETFTHWMVSEAIPTAVEKMNDFGKKMAEWVGQAAVDLLVALPGWLNTFGKWVKEEGLPAVFNYGVDLAKEIGKGIWSALNFMSDMGKSIVDGLIKGLWDNAKRLADSLADWVNKNIPGPIRKILQIFSPSKVMMGIGGEIAEGLAVGIAAGADQVAKSSQLLADTASMMWPSKANAFPSVRYNPDGTVQFGGDATNYPGSVIVGTGVAKGKATSANVVPLGLRGDDMSSSGYSLSGSGYSGGGGVFNYYVTINGYANIAELIDAIRRFQLARA